MALFLSNRSPAQGPALGSSPKGHFKQTSMSSSWWVHVCVCAWQYFLKTYIIFLQEEAERVFLHQKLVESVQWAPVSCAWWHYVTFVRANSSCSQTPIAQIQEWESGNKTELVTSFLPSASVLHVFTVIGFACRISKSSEAARQSQSKSQPLPVVHEGQQNRPNLQSKQAQPSVKTDPTISQDSVKTRERRACSLVQVIKVYA